MADIDDGWMQRNHEKFTYYSSVRREILIRSVMLVTYLWISCPIMDPGWPIIDYHEVAGYPRLKLDTVTGGAWAIASR